MPQDQYMCQFSILSLLVLALTIMLTLPGYRSQTWDEEEDWFPNGEVPEVDLEGLVHNLSLQIPWFKYVGEVTLDCADKARVMDTLMESIDTLHDCLEASYHKCASEYAVEKGCRRPLVETQPCGAIRLGPDTSFGYEPNLDCRWYIRVPDLFLINVTVDEFYMEWAGGDCMYDWAMFYDGNTTNALRKWGPYCGRIPRFVLYGSKDHFLVVAHTDATNGKYGFRAVYQVLEEGRGSTLGEPWYSDDLRGNFSLDPDSAVMYERLWYGIYSNKWTIQADISQLFTVLIKYKKMGFNTSLGVYDGTTEFNNDRFPWHLKNKTGQEVKYNITASIGHVMYIQLLRDNLTEGTTLSVKWRAFDRTWSNLSEMNDHQCINGGDIYLKTGNKSKRVPIGLPDSAQTINGVPIICFWHINASSNFIQLNITALAFRGPNTRDCMEEGLFLIDGDDIKASEKRYGPFCYDDPRGFLTKHSGLKSLASTHNELTIVYYSFINYKSPYAPWKRGIFKASVATSDCVGIWQPCVRPPQNIRNRYLELNTTDDLEEQRRKVNLECEKEKCCVLQQLPIYEAMTPVTHCEITVGVKAEETSHLSTSVFKTALAVPGKNISELSYGCEQVSNVVNIQSRLRQMLLYCLLLGLSAALFIKLLLRPTKRVIREKQFIPGGSNHLCLGTHVYLEYMSLSPWSHGAFAVEVFQSDCGYFRPDLHVMNLFYPPCALAEIPATNIESEIRYIDTGHTDISYYRYVVDYKDIKHCPNARNESGPCITARFEVKEGEVMSFGWSVLPEWPFYWYTWPSTKAEKSWLRQVRVKREMNDTCKVREHCELTINFTNHVRQDNRMLREHVECPAGFDRLGDRCYRLVWPGQRTVTPDTLMSGLEGLSSEEAERKCREHKAHLISLDDEEEVYRIWQELFPEWWSKYLRYIPGLKIFHTGFRDYHKEPVNVWRWTTGRTVSFTRWSAPAAQFLWPDQTRQVRSQDIIDLVRADSIKDRLQAFHPDTDPQLGCAAFALVTPHVWEEMRMYKVPCRTPLQTAVGLCEAEPSRYKTAKRKLKPNKIFTTTKQRKDDQNILKSAKFKCPYSFVPFQDKCLMLYFNHGKSAKQGPSRVTASQLCKNYGEHKTPLAQVVAADDSDNIYEYRADKEADKEQMKYRITKTNPRPASLTEEMMPDFKLWLRSMLHEPKDGGILIVHNDTGTKSCYAVIPEESRFRGAPLDWNLTLRTQCNAGQNLKAKIYSYMCEVDPIEVPLTCQANQFQCKDGTCIVAHHVCDRVKDCVDGSDEFFCDHICELNDPGRRHEMIDCQYDCHPSNCTCNDMQYFQCRSGGCIPISKMCDLEQDCPDNSDEHATCSFTKCPAGHLVCDQTTNHDRVGRCISEAQRCDKVRDCVDGKDEEDCDWENGCPHEMAVKKGRASVPGDGGAVERKQEYFQCDGTDGDTRCLPTYMKNDLVADCKGELPSDETLLKSFWARKNWNKKSGNRGIKYEKGLLAVYPDVYCRENRISCNGYIKQCFQRHEICVFEPTLFGTLKSCRGGEHLRHCENFQCSGMYKCPKSYCISLDRVCDGTLDCENGEDEQNCASLLCPGMFKCRGESRCIEQHQVCDTKLDCLMSGDDEELCHYLQFPCIDKCSCLGHSIDCRDNNFTSIPRYIDREIRSIVFSNNLLRQVPKMFIYPKLYTIDLSNNRVSSIRVNAFMTSYMVRELYLHDNTLDSLSGEQFKGLRNLKVLTLWGNRMSHLGQHAFIGLESLPVVNLSYQEIRQVEDYSFEGLSSVEVIDVSHNEITEIRNKTFANKMRGKTTGFKTLKVLDNRGNKLSKVELGAYDRVYPHTYLMTTRFKYCCLARQIRRCYPPPDEFSSCDHLLHNITLRFVVWLLGLMAFCGNAVVLQQRLKHEKETTPSILLQHLAFADLMMGAYLMIIAGADVKFRGEYMRHFTDSWRQHAVCKLCGFLYMISTMMSTYMVLLMTGDRMYAMIPSCQAHGMGLRSGRGLIALGWTASAVVSIIPVLGFAYFGGGKARNGACILFNLTAGRAAPGWEVTFVIFILVNFFVFLFMASGYIRALYWSSKGLDIWQEQLNDNEDMTEEEKEIELKYRKNEMAITYRLFLLVNTNWIIWFPLILLGIVALIGVEIPHNFAGWVLIGLVPLNSAINPFLYSFSTFLYRPRHDLLLANWQPESEDEENLLGPGDEDDDEQTRANKAAAYQEAILREIM